MTEDIYQEDRFYIDLQNDDIIWMYHNPDSVSGDQFVRNIFSFDMLNEAIREFEFRSEGNLDASQVFDYIEENCRQYLSDVGMESYENDKELFESKPVASSLTRNTLYDLQLMNIAKHLINEYCLNEFESYADFSDPKRIGIAYTTTEDERHEIQVYANLIDHCTELYFDGDFIDKCSSDSLKDYVENQLPYLDFNELVYVPDWVIDKYNGTGAYRPDLKFLHFEAWDSAHKACLETGNYAYGGGLAIELYEKYSDDSLEPYASMTVNIPGYDNETNCAFVDINNFPGVVKIIEEYNLGKPTGIIGFSGYCSYPEYEFNIDEIGKYCINPENIQEMGIRDRERSDER